MPKFIAEIRDNLPVTEIGGKGHCLNFLINNGFNVPQGFIVTISAFYCFLNHNNLLNEINNLISGQIERSVKEVSSRIKGLVLRGDIPQEIIAEVQKSLKQLRIQHLSVRSSSVSEDSFGASFAGLFDTFLNVNSDLPLVLENIKKCWASLFNERAMVYRIAKGVPHFEGMAVIIQEMIPARVSGVTFTVHPLNRKLLLIEASYGLGDLLVGGKIEPDQYAIDRETLDLIDKRIGSKDKMSVLEGTEVKTLDIPQKLAKRLVLSNAKVKEIANVCLKVEKTFNYPQDVEWCIFNDNLWLLQSRPETSLKWKKANEKS